MTRLVRKQLWKNMPGKGGTLVKVDPESGNQGPIIRTTEDKVFAE